MKPTLDMFQKTDRIFEGWKPIPIYTVKPEYEGEMIAHVFADKELFAAFSGKTLDEQVGMSEIHFVELSGEDGACAPTREEMLKEWGKSENAFHCDGLLLTEAGLYLGILYKSALAFLGGCATFCDTARTGDDNNGAGYKEGYSYDAIFSVMLYYSPAVWDKTTLYRNRAFCELVDFTVPDGVMRIGRKAFYDCKKLRTVTLPKTLRSIDVEAFHGCSALFEVALPEGLKEIHYAAFCACGLKAVTLPRSLVYIGARAFSFCRSLSEFAFPAGFGAIPEELFMCCSGLVRVELPKDIEYIGRYAFYECSALTEITLPEGLREIRDNAFEKCTALDGLVIPKSVTTVGWGALYGPKNTVYLNKR